MCSVSVTRVVSWGRRSYILGRAVSVTGIVVDDLVGSRRLAESDR